MYPGCERQIVHTSTGYTLYHYHPKTSFRHPTTPILIVYALVNTPKIVDLHPDCSFIQNLLEKNQEVFLLEWKRPTLGQQAKSLTDYICADMDEAITMVCNVSSCARIHLLGICQGGYFSLCYSALFPEKIASLILMVTPIDFDVPYNRLFQLSRYIDIEKIVNMLGNVPGELLNTFLKQIEPFRTPFKKWQLFNEEGISKEIYEAIEQWSEDCPPLAGQAFLEFVYAVQQNRLIQNTLVINHQPILLSAIKLPILNIYARYDYLWPTQTVKALQKHYMGDRYQEVIFEGGHIGIFVSKKALEQIPSAIQDWVGA